MTDRHTETRQRLSRIAAHVEDQPMIQQRTLERLRRQVLAFHGAFHRVPLSAAERMDNTDGGPHD